jgi:hypothetical protein
VKSRQRRVRTIELSLTPRQIVMLWLKNALQAGGLEEGVEPDTHHRIASLLRMRYTVHCCQQCVSSLRIRGVFPEIQVRSRLKDEPHCSDLRLGVRLFV